MAPVLLVLRLAREVEVEMCRPPGRARRASEHYAQYLSSDLVVDERDVAEQLARRLRREPRAHKAARPFARQFADPLASCPQLPLEHKGVVAPGFHLHQQAIEGGDVGAGSIEARLERLHERRPGTRERVEHVLPRREVTAAERLDTLWDALAQVWVQPVDVLRPLALRQLAFGPREVELEVAIEGVLRRCYGLGLFGEPCVSPSGAGRRRPRFLPDEPLRSQSRPGERRGRDSCAARLARRAATVRASTHPRPRADRRTRALPSA